MSLVITQCIFGVIIFTMNQLRLKLALINLDARVDDKVEELTKKLKAAAIVGMEVVSLYTVGVSFGIMLELSKKNTNGVIIVACKSLNQS